MLDSSGSNRSGVYSGVTLGAPSLLATDSSNSAAVFTGSSTGFVDTGGWMQVGAITVEAWIKPASIASGNSVIAGRSNFGTLATPNYAWHFFRSGSSIGVFVMNASGAYVEFTAPTGLLTTDAAAHAAFTFDGSTVRLYLNGTERATRSLSGTLNAPQYLKLGIGTVEYSGQRWNGTLDEVALYGSALSATRIQAHYNAGAVAAPSSTTGTLSGSLGPLAGAFGGTVTAPVAVTGALSGNLPSLTAGLSGTTGEVLPVTAALSGALPQMRGEFAGTVVDANSEVGAATQTTNRTYGRTRVCEWTVEIEPPVAEPKRDRGHDYVISTSISGTDAFIDGRPT